MKPIERAIYMHKLIIHYDMLIMKNIRKIRFYSTKKTLLMSELMDVMGEVSDNDDANLMAELGILSMAMNKLEDDILKLISTNSLALEYFK